ncbi:hypothetical protein D3C80_1080350 [compost metagenome]
MACQRTGNRHALLLAAGQIGRVGVVFVRQPDQFQQFGYALFDFSPWGVVQLQRQRNVAKYRAGRKQVEVLEDHADLAACACQFAFRQRGQILSVNQHLAGSRALKHVGAADQRTFTGA